MRDVITRFSIKRGCYNLGDAHDLNECLKEGGIGYYAEFKREMRRWRRKMKINSKRKRYSDNRMFIGGISIVAYDFLDRANKFRFKTKKRG